MVLMIVVLVIAAAAAGFFVPRYFQYPSRIDFKYKFPDQVISPKPIAPNVSYDCLSMTRAEVYENRDDGPTANVSSGKGGDVVSLKVSSDGKGFLVSFPYAAADDTDFSAPVPIASNTEGLVVANKSNGTDLVSIIFDLNTLKAIYSFTGQGMTGIRGRSLLLACR